MGGQVLFLDEEGEDDVPKPDDRARGTWDTRSFRCPGVHMITPASSGFGHYGSMGSISVTFFSARKTDVPIQEDAHHRRG